MRCQVGLLRFCVVMAAYSLGLQAPGAAVMETQSWENKDPAFDQFARRVESNFARNLLARPKVKVFVEPESASRSAELLADGDAGSRGERGRCFIGGRPTVFTYYLGEPKTIKEIGLLSFNVDTRSNQDYEVRLADNSSQPGTRPAFADKPDLTSGDRVIGADKGGFHTRFFDPSGAPLVPGKVDWVQFRIWGTHTAKAGDPARTGDSRGAAVVVELEVLGDEHDVRPPTKQDLELRAAMRTAPREPPYAKQATWHETLIAGREALLAWETLQDRIVKLNASRGGAGPAKTRVARRAQLAARVRSDFPGPADQLQIRWELSDGVWISDFRRQSQLDDWRPGQVEPYLQRKYQQAIEQRAAAIRADLADPSGVKGRVLSKRKGAIESWLSQTIAAPQSEVILAARRQTYYRLALVQELAALDARLESIRLAVADQAATFERQYPKASRFLELVGAEQTKVDAAWGALLGGSETAMETILEQTGRVDRLQADVLLDTPLLAFDKLLVVKGRQGFASNWGGPNRLGEQIAVLSPVRPDGALTTLHQGAISDMDLHWDGQRVLFSDGQALWEIKTDGTGLRRVTREDPPVTHYDACYLPDGRIVCASNACEQAVPCTGGANVGNLHVLDADGSGERRVTYDQDHDWNPVVLNDGRVLYTRWEYADLPHYFSRLLFRMNPDGTGQMEYYGSNSYWPNAMYWPRPIPGHPTMVVCVVSGHHGVSRVGELLLLDPARGRHEAAGAIQRIPGYGKPVQPIIRDNLVGESWPKFASPYPLAEPETCRGAGKYFLACVQRDPSSSWDLCLVDVFDNITPILTGGYAMPIPLRPRPTPPVVPSQMDPRAGDGVVYLADVYQGDGLRGYPRGSIKALRVGTQQAQALRQSAGPNELDLDLGAGVTMKLVLVPAGRFVMGDTQGFADEQAEAVVNIDRSFYLGRFEVSNRQYAQFDSAHDSGYIETRGKDRISRGIAANEPDQPVVRVSWNRALDFCEWLSRRTGRGCTLPTEAQWEWACRAGTATPFSFGRHEPGKKNLANVADTGIEKWNYGRSEPGYEDGVAYSAPGGRFPPNAWDLCDMHGNVAEWCLSTYRPYPYQPGDGRDDRRSAGMKVVRGGSWNDTFRYATSASRWRYQPHQPVYNVGFRVLCETAAPATVAQADRRQ